MYVRHAVVCTSVVKIDTIIDMKCYVFHFILNSVPFLIVHCKDLMSIICIKNEEKEGKNYEMLVYSKKSVKRSIEWKKCTKDYYVTISIFDTVSVLSAVRCVYTAVVIFLSASTNWFVRVQNITQSKWKRSIFSLIYIILNMACYSMLCTS